MITEKVTSFIPDAIREAGNTIAAAIQGGGGSSVEWSQIVTTGTKIATITIDEQSTDVYAPSGGGGGSTVSWNEIQTTGTKIAEITIDGTTYDVYAPNVSVSASDVSYDNTTSGLNADDVQEAIDELDSTLDTLSGTVSGHTTDIGNLQTAVGSKANQSIIAPVETSTTASQAYAIGEQFILNGTLYTATAAITLGGTITIGGNCTASDTVTEQINNIKQGETVYVTTDGTKTWQALLNALFALVDNTKINVRSVLVYKNDIYACANLQLGNTYLFTGNNNIANQKVYQKRFGLRSTNSSADEFSNTTYTTLTNTVPASGDDITIYY